MGPAEFVTALVGIVFVFGSPVVITALILKHRSQTRQVKTDEIDQLRADLGDMRREIRDQFAEMTLMLDDATRRRLPDGDE